MLDAHSAIVIIALIPQRLDVGLAKHVAIHEQRPALVLHQIGNQETRERKRSALLGIPFTVEQTLVFQLRRHHGCNRQRDTAVLIQAIDQDVGGSALTRVVADKNRNRHVGVRHGALGDAGRLSRSLGRVEQTLAVNETALHRNGG